MPSISFPSPLPLSGKSLSVHRGYLDQIRPLVHQCGQKLANAKMAPGWSSVVRFATSFWSGPVVVPPTQSLSCPKLKISSFSCSPFHWLLWSLRMPTMAFMPQSTTTSSSVLVQHKAERCEDHWWNKQPQRQALICYVQALVTSCSVMSMSRHSGMTLETQRCILEWLCSTTLHHITSPWLVGLQIHVIISGHGSRSRDHFICSRSCAWCCAMTEEFKV